MTFAVTEKGRINLKEDWADIALMREHGHTYQEIAEKYGVSKQCIHAKMKAYKRAVKGIRGANFDVNKIVYKSIYDYFMSNYKETLNTFTGKIYGYQDGPNTYKVRSYITGETKKFPLKHKKMIAFIIGKPCEDLFE